MAAGIISPPGSEFGPCESDCTHRDCAESRMMAEVLCGLCHERIGYDVRLYGSGRKLDHAACREKDADSCPA